MKIDLFITRKTVKPKKLKFGLNIRINESVMLPISRILSHVIVN